MVVALVVVLVEQLDVNSGAASPEITPCIRIIRPHARAPFQPACLLPWANPNRQTKAKDLGVGNESINSSADM
jgi:hypothetical protein